MLSGRHGGVSMSAVQRYNNVGPRLSRHPFPNDPDPLMDLLDALAAICVRKEKWEVFYVFMAIDPNAVTLFVSSNETVPASVTSRFDRLGVSLRSIRFETLQMTNFSHRRPIGC
jgi:hypothetical protein